MPDEKATLHALATLRLSIPPLRLRELVRSTGSLTKAWEAPEETLIQHRWTEEQRRSFNEHRQQWDVEKEYSRLKETDTSILSFEDDSFPLLLKQIFDPPLALYVRGTLSPQDLAIAFVGSRKATPYGKTAVNILVRPLASKGIAIVSGLAYGIDAEAHRAALSVHGKTIAVLGSGNDDSSLYPRAHRQLALDIIATGGAVISEYPPGTSAQGYFFPQRNRIIAGLSRAVVVVEAGERSGALITAHHALEQNRDVFAVPGPITSPSSQGTNTLLKEGATPACTVEDIIEALELSELLEEGKGPSSEQLELPNDDAAKILAVLSKNPISIDEIVKQSTLSPNTVASLITILELDGRIRDVGGRNYVRM